MNDILHKNLNEFLKLSNHIKKTFGVDTTYDNVVDKAIELMNASCNYEIRRGDEIAVLDDEWIEISASDADRNPFGHSKMYARKIKNNEE